ncbi:MAG TPA: hypothetical protein VJB12_05150 [Candidatus Nanoarchaeia archaeon]|nr:hypothetical protein [Candidatus Nanoarchaeia archaeon]
MDTPEPEEKKLTLADVVDREEADILSKVDRMSESPIKKKKERVILDTPIEKSANLNLGLPDIVENAIRKKGYPSRQNYLDDAEDRGIIQDSKSARSWFGGAARPFNLFYLRRIADDLEIPESDLEKRYGRNPFVPQLEEYLKSENPFNRLLDFYVTLRTGKSRRNFFNERKETFKKSLGHYFSPSAFSIKELKFLMDELEIPPEEIAAVLGYDPTKPPIECSREEGNPYLTLNWYVDSLGKKRQDYLQEKEGILFKHRGTARGWFSNVYKIPVPALGLIARDLGVSLDDLTRSFVAPKNPHLTVGWMRQFMDEFGVSEETICQAYGSNPFAISLENVKNAKFPLGEFLDWYIEVRTGKSREEYLQSKEGKLFTTRAAAVNWFVGRNPFPKHVLREIVDELTIPPEEINEILGYNPFEPPLSDFKQSSTPLLRLIDWNLDFKGKGTISNYLKNKIGTFFENDGTAWGWIKQAFPIPTPVLKLISDDIGISIEHLTEVYITPSNPHLTPGRIHQYMLQFGVSLETIVKNFGTNPFVAPIETFTNLIGLLDWYIELRTQGPRQPYLRDKEGHLFYSWHSAHNWFGELTPFPPSVLKNIVDDLQIPYHEVNQFLDYDISDPLQVAIRNRNATPAQIIQSAFESLNIPTDSKSLYELASSLGETADIGISELVDILYLANPAQIDALIRKKIGKQDVRDSLRQYLLSDSGTSLGSGSSDLPPFLTITRAVPYDSYQKEAALRSHLIDMSLRSHMGLPYEVAMQRINSQLDSQPDNKVLQHVLTETRDYLAKVDGMPPRMVTVGK